ncbi:hypothetical protein TPHA_0I02190 [Tetrapisispora phaffii CBS 4417]|uniref:Uncharacterized protein n=1 Tax=Tetrapisispora phaffii (strain ATCC 24235 / CBS 4417 / NBRC 1672 / NRRL Y-8282 / UCD 70-5) TaxID=1071381 RepID=G8BXU5_TETPH|nr:hypothetical protein TPHA_0I02190 [Tetrapisispora phaffii CBS 4417]CCE64723.1 hypothetical protein TPHA_0I02190 [Tetrapisispora phaffii CBS 4417]
MQMSIAKFAALLAVAASASALTTEQQIQEMEILLTDVGANLNDYVGLVGQMDIPDALFDIYGEMLTATDDSYTTLLAQLDMSQISTMMTALPWYSSRLLPLVSTFNDVAAAAATSSTAAAATTSSSVAAETTSSSVAAVTTSSSVAAATTSSSSAAETTSTSAAAETTSSAAAAKTTVAAVSQITDGQIQATTTATIHVQTDNGATRNAAGLGAVAFAAAMLL